MPRILPNDSVAQNRRIAVVLHQDDGVTRIAATTAVLGTKASRKLGGLTGNLSGLTIQVPAIGVAGNAYTLAITADGAGTGSFTNVGSAWTFHYATGVTTVNNFIALLGPLNSFSVFGSYTGTNFLLAGDATAALKFAGGSDSSLFVRPGNTVTEAVAAGILTWILRASVAQAGRAEYEFTQTEINHTALKTMLAFDRVPDPAMLDLSTKTARCTTIIYDKLAIGADGNVLGQNALTPPVTLAFLNDGAGAGTLSAVGNAWTFHYASATTTVKNFEDAIVASSRFAIWQYATNWTNVLTNPGDTFTATNLSGGVSYEFDEFNADMRAGDFDCQDENGKSYGDTNRAKSAVLLGKVVDFRTTGLGFLSLDGTKTRVAGTTGADGRDAVSFPDLTP